MTARAIWKGVLKLEDQELPVKMYSAVENRDIHFHLLHDQDQVHVQQRMVNSETNKTVVRESTKKGFQLEPDTFVVFEESELEELEPPASRDIAIEQFVDVNAINNQWYDRPYWLGPDGDEAAYFEFVQALSHQKVQAVVRWTMRKRRYVGVVRAEENYLVLMTLHFAEEIIPADKLDAPTGRTLDKKEKTLAGQLISALEAKFDHAKFQDEYRERVRKLIEAKHKGKKIEVKRVEKKPATKSLADSLRASLHGLKK